ncbi:MAG: AbrB/MazE/SpoVT family DNA-binding domain-containing protein [Spirochaetales bacterium]|nr:AbrB/MazE/SpoVT family DNA-binding domain-containing protein [Spirochaetales bacterium]
MRATVQKWGNSLALRIPVAFAKDAHMATGSEVDLSIHDGIIHIDPAPEPHYSLPALLREVTDQNRHTEVDAGEAVGQEAW